MIREFLIRTENQKDDCIVDAVASREDEIASYDVNVDAYQAQLAAMDAVLPQSWSKELEKYKGKTAEQVYVIGGTPEDMLLAVKMNHRERVRMLLFTETAEREKSELAYAQVKNQLPVDPEKLSAAIARHSAKTADATAAKVL